MRLMNDADVPMENSGSEQSRVCSKGKGLIPKSMTRQFAAGAGATLKRWHDTYRVYIYTHIIS